jgi:hypothetical protein
MLAPPPTIRNLSLIRTAEIRDHIYSFTCEPSEETLTISTNPNEEQKRFHVSARRFYHSTQVCSTMRSEFLPLYRLHNAVHIYHYNLPAYIDMLVHTTDGSIVGNIAIDMHYGPDESLDEPNSIDLLPILMLCKNAPNLKLQTGLEYCSCCNPSIWKNDAMNKTFFDISKHLKFAAWMEAALVAIKLGYQQELELKVKKGFWQSWMGKWHQGKQGDGKEMRVWFDGVGLKVEQLGRNVLFGMVE